MKTKKKANKQTKKQKRKEQNKKTKQKTSLLQNDVDCENQRIEKALKEFQVTSNLDNNASEYLPVNCSFNL